jgi:hypothetical protein
MLEVPIDKEDQSVVQSLRRTPFNLRERLEQKIDELEQFDEIEKATGPKPVGMGCRSITIAEFACRISIQRRISLCSGTTTGEIEGFGPVAFSITSNCSNSIHTVAIHRRR